MTVNSFIDESVIPYITMSASAPDGVPAFFISHVDLKPDKLSVPPEANVIWYDNNF